MKVFVKEEKCIGCGSCVSITEEKIFDFNEDGKAYAKIEEIPEEEEKNVKMAIEYCPTDAISEKTEKTSKEGDQESKKD